MTPRATLLRFALPAGITLMLVLTMQTVTSNNGESTTGYGFPFAWHAPSAVSSMAFDIAWGALAVNALLHVLACYGVARLARRPLAGRTGGRVSVLLWLVALVCTVLTVWIVGTDPHFTAWSLDSYFGAAAQRSHRLHLGPGRWQ